MLVEHVFVTTLDAPEALRRASMFLNAKGFTARSQGAFGMTGDWDSISMQRGVSNAAKAKSVADLPQDVRVHWDRGRVTVAASIDSTAPSGFTVTRNELKVDSPKVVLHRNLLMAIVQGLELLLAHQRSPDEAWQTWNDVELHISLDSQQRRRRRRIGFTIAIVFVMLAITAMVLAAIYG